jgi:aromatic ring-opening dioxygenase LigB subunit
MGIAVKALADTKPDRVILLDPHLNRYPSAYACVSMPGAIRGNFKAFGRSDLEIEFPSDNDFCSHLASSASDNQFSVEILEVDELDHGATVPLWFLGAAGYKGPVCILGFPWKTPQQTHNGFGRFLNMACGRYKGNTAIIASGDMSHRLQYGAPSGYHPNAYLFDKVFREYVEAGELAEASQIRVDLRDLAAEDASESMAIAAGAIGDKSPNAKVLSYEAPFGVGYLIAILA